MKKFIIFTFVICALAAVAYAGNARLVLDGSGNVIQLPSYVAGQSKTTGIYKNSFVNFSTNSQTFHGFAAATETGSAGTLVVVKARIGGFVTGNETDVITASSKDFVLDGATKVGYQNYSGAVKIRTLYK